jgi:hypothetical protein
MRLLDRPDIESVTAVQRDPDRLRDLDALNGPGARFRIRRAYPLDLPDADVVVLAVPHGTARLAAAALARGAHVVATADDPSEVRALLALDELARDVERVVVVGAAMAPGLSCVLARQAAQRLERVDEVHVASLGTGGPACARQHHASFSLTATDWHDGEWRRRPGGSGRELLWFPEPVGGVDCYRAGMADALLLAPAFPGVRRVTARRHATRRDRLTSALPMLRRPHPEGLIGAVRAEVRGWAGERAQTVTLGAVARPAVAAGAVAALAATWAVQGRFAHCGAAGLAELIERPGPYLRDLADLGIVAAMFEGAATS